MLEYEVKVTIPVNIKIDENVLKRIMPDFNRSMWDADHEEIMKHIAYSCTIDVCSNATVEGVGLNSIDFVCKEDGEVEYEVKVISAPSEEFVEWQDCGFNEED